MKLLLDEHLSDRLLAGLANAFSGSSHVKQRGLLHADDQEIWEHAKQHGFVLLTKDRDFEQLCVLHGAPPKVVWLRIGNRSTRYVAELLRRNVQALREFDQDAKTSLLIIGASAGA